MLLPILAIVIGLVVLAWSADRFVDGAVGVACHFGMSTLLIGIVVVGFGTSAPEMIVSAISALENNSGIALGNAYGSNIANIALILGSTALLAPVAVKPCIVKRDLPLLLVGTAIAAFQIVDGGGVSRWDGLVLLAIFAILLSVSAFAEMRQAGPAKPEAPEDACPAKTTGLGRSILWILLGLALLVASSRALVWGSVQVARALGASDLFIGLTIVAIGTSLPELAASIAAARKKETDLVMGNIIGSNLFNTLVVVGIAAVIRPMDAVDPLVLRRDIPVMLILTILLLVFGLKRPHRDHGRLNRWEGALFLVAYAAYAALLIAQCRAPAP